MRTRVDWRASCKDNYDNFCKENPSIKVSYLQWKNIIYGFNESFREYILETGDKAKLPLGFGEFSINKRKRKQMITKPDGTQEINLPVDYKKSKEKGKRIYNFNFHTEGYYFGWAWFKKTARFKQPWIWYFKPCRNTSRLLAHYINTDEQYQHLYHQWRV
jgi:nucleoid DNA-binding protein